MLSDYFLFLIDSTIFNPFSYVTSCSLLFILWIQGFLATCPLTAHLYLAPTVVNPSPCASVFTMFTFDGRILGVGKWGILFGSCFLIRSSKGSCYLGGSVTAGMHVRACEENCTYIWCPFSDARIHQIYHLNILFYT